MSKIDYFMNSWFHMFHKSLFICMCLLAFLAGVISAGNSSILMQREIVKFMVSQPPIVLTYMQVE